MKACDHPLCKNRNDNTFCIRQKKLPKMHGSLPKFSEAKDTNSDEIEKNTILDKYNRKEEVDHLIDYSERDNFIGALKMLKKEAKTNVDKLKKKKPKKNILVTKKIDPNDLYKDNRKFFYYRKPSLELKEFLVENKDKNFLDFSVFCLKKKMKRYFLEFVKRVIDEKKQEKKDNVSKSNKEDLENIEHNETNDLESSNSLNKKIENSNLKKKGIDLSLTKEEISLKELQPNSNFFEHNSISLEKANSRYPDIFDLKNLNNPEEKKSELVDKIGKKNIDNEEKTKEENFNFKLSEEEIENVFDLENTDELENLKAKVSNLEYEQRSKKISNENNIKEIIESIVMEQNQEEGQILKKKTINVNLDEIHENTDNLSKEYLSELEKTENTKDRKNSFTSNYFDLKKTSEEKKSDRFNKWANRSNKGEKKETLNVEYKSSIVSPKENLEEKEYVKKMRHASIKSGINAFQLYQKLEEEKEIELNKRRLSLNERRIVNRRSFIDTVGNDFFKNKQISQLKIQEEEEKRKKRDNKISDSSDSENESEDDSENDSDMEDDSDLSLSEGKEKKQINQNKNNNFELKNEELYIKKENLENDEIFMMFNKNFEEKEEEEEINLFNGDKADLEENLSIERSSHDETNEEDNEDQNNQLFANNQKRPSRKDKVSELEILINLAKQKRKSERQERINQKNKKKSEFTNQTENKIKEEILPVETNQENRNYYLEDKDQNLLKEEINNNFLIETKNEKIEKINLSESEKKDKNKKNENDLKIILLKNEEEITNEKENVFEKNMEDFLSLEDEINHTNNIKEIIKSQSSSFISSDSDSEQYFDQENNEEILNEEEKKLEEAEKIKAVLKKITENLDSEKKLSIINEERLSLFARNNKKKPKKNIDDHFKIKEEDLSSNNSSDIYESDEEHFFSVITQSNRNHNQFFDFESEKIIKNNISLKEVVDEKPSFSIQKLVHKNIKKIYKILAEDFKDNYANKIKVENLKNIRTLQDNKNDKNSISQNNNYLSKNKSKDIFFNESVFDKKIIEEKKLMSEESDISNEDENKKIQKNESSLIFNSNLRESNYLGNQKENEHLITVATRKNSLEYFDDDNKTEISKKTLRTSQILTSQIITKRKTQFVKNENIEIEIIESCENQNCINEKRNQNENEQLVKIATRKNSLENFEDDQKTEISEKTLRTSKVLTSQIIFKDKPNRKTQFVKNENLEIEMIESCENQNCVNELHKKEIIKLTTRKNSLNDLDNQEIQSFQDREPSLKTSNINLLNNLKDKTKSKKSLFLRKPKNDIFVVTHSLTDLEKNDNDSNLESFHRNYSFGGFKLEKSETTRKFFSTIINSPQKEKDNIDDTETINKKEWEKYKEQFSIKMMSKMNDILEKRPYMSAKTNFHYLNELMSRMVDKDFIIFLLTLDEDEIEKILRIQRFWRKKINKSIIKKILEGQFYFTRESRLTNMSFKSLINLKSIDKFEKEKNPDSLYNSSFN